MNVTPPSKIKKIAIVGGILVVVQLAFMVIFGGGSSNAPSDLNLNPPAAPAASIAAEKSAAAANTPTSGGKVSTASSARLTADMVAALPDEAPTPSFVYDATGKRDPFRPFDFAPKRETGDNLTPLEQYNIGQLKLTAVLDGFEQPAAVVENAAGKGFTVKKGTKIGPNGGVISEILSDKILIVETTTDFSGVTKSQTIELAIRTSDQNKGAP